MDNENRAMNSSQDRQDTVVIEPKKQNPLTIILALLVLAIWTYFRFEKTLHDPTNSMYWVRLALLLVLWGLFIGAFVYRRMNPQAGVLKLTPIGFSKDRHLYPWREIEHFGITGANAGVFSGLFTKKVVFWNFRESSPSRTLLHKCSRVFVGYDEGVMAKNYEIPAEDLVRMLNDRMISSTGKSSEINYQGGGEIRLTRKELTPRQNKLVLLNLILIISVAAYSTYYYVTAEKDLRNMRGAEYIAIGTQDRLYFFYRGNIYRLSLKDDTLEKMIETTLEVPSEDVVCIAVSSSGNIFLTNPKTRQIDIYTSSGKLVRS